jgi:3-oxoacyl-[acyl-carrier-protein] synthase II
MNERWAITGMGMVTSVGWNVDDCFDAFCAGRSGHGPLQAFEKSRFHAQHAYEIADRDNGCDRKGRVTSWLCQAISEAVGAAGLEAGVDIPVLTGTGLRELRSLELWRDGAASFHAGELHFGGALRKAIPGAGPVMTCSNACAASNFALGLGADLISLGEADAVIVAGCDSITASMFGLLDRVNPMHPERVQPFDRNRRGVLMGEGAAAVVIESSERARKRGAPVQAWLRGVGMSCDAYHSTAPARDGITRAMRDAHQRSGVTPEEIDLLMVHGTGTLLNDATEALAVRDVFGVRVGNMWITAIKSMTGHTSGASGLVGVITAAECMKRAAIPPTIGLSELSDEAQGFRFVTGAAAAASPTIAQVNAFGFGGVNAVAVLESASYA